MADEKQIRVSFTLSQDDALQLIQYARQQFNVDVIQDIQIQDIQSQAQYENQLIFISYRRDDSRDVCGRIYDILSDEFHPTTIFRDLESLPPGMDWSSDIVRNVELCTLMLVIIGPDWLEILNERLLSPPDETDYVRLEIGTALQRSIPVIPIYVNEASYLQIDDLPSDLQDLANRNAVIIRPDAHFRPDVRDLIDKIKQLFALSENPDDEEIDSS